MTRSSSDASSVAPTTAPSLDPSKIAVRATTESAELRGAAAARALAFYTYPSDRSEFSIRSHRNMRIDAEWDAIGEKIRGEDVAFRDTRVECVVVALTLDEDGALPDGFAYDANTLDAACVVPKSETTPALLILGTLDVNQGAKLPAEELAGMHPGTDDPVPEGTDISQDSFGTNKGNYGNGESDFDAKIRAYEDSLGTRPVRYRRGYLSNVCVLAAARRLGIGHLLMEESLKVGKTWGIETMYVHVEAENVGAKRFYEKNGFEVCEQETEAYALSLSRPRRLLLSRTVGGVLGGSRCDGL